jgi:hypothetical protein
MNVNAEQINGVIHNAIVRFSKEFNCLKDRIALWVEPSGENLKLFILLDSKKQKEIRFKELLSTFEYITFKPFFDIEIDLPVIFKRVMVKIEEKRGFPYEKQQYYIRLFNEKAIMFVYNNFQMVEFEPYVDETNKGRKDVPIEFIINN